MSSLIAEFQEMGLQPPTQHQIDEHSWQDIVETQSPSERFNAYALLESQLDSGEKGALFAFTWVHSEGCYTEDQINMIFGDLQSSGVTLDMILTDAEREELAALPDPFTIYRGCQESTREGISWTLSQDVAHGFAQRAADEDHENQTGLVIQAQCPKDAVRAYFNGDLAEQEVVVDPSRISPTETPVESVSSQD